MKREPLAYIKRQEAAVLLKLIRGEELSPPERAWAMTATGKLEGIQS